MGRKLLREFLRELDDLTEVPDDDRERPIIILFHNLKGFDGMFILHDLYSDMQAVETQLSFCGRKFFPSKPVH